MSGSWRYCYNEVGPFSALIIVQFTEVGVNILFKDAVNEGFSYYVFIFYSFSISTLILLLPLPFISSRLNGLPSFNFSLLCKVFSLGLLQFSAQVCGYKGIEYSSPTLASAVSNLVPALIFILAVFFRMETVNITSSSTQAKIIGSVTSIAGALVVVLYKGPTLLNAASQSQPPSLDSRLFSSQLNWILGGFLLAVAYTLMSIWYILLTHVIKLYPSEFIVTFLCNFSATIIAAPVCFLAEANLGAWKLKPDIALVAVIYSVSNYVISATSHATFFIILSTWLTMHKSMVTHMYRIVNRITNNNERTYRMKNLLTDPIHENMINQKFLQALFSTIISTVVHTWGLHMKGPVYVSIFKPLSIAIAAAMSVIFLGEALYLGSVVGAVILSIGFYSVIWGKSKEELIEDDENFTLSNLRFQSNSVDPLLQGGPVHNAST